MKRRLKLASGKELSFLTKIVEGAGHVAVIQTINGQEGLADVLCTPEQWAEVEELLQTLQKRGAITILSIN